MNYEGHAKTLQNVAEVYIWHNLALISKVIG